MTPELIGIFPEEVYAVIRLKIKDADALYRGMTHASVIHNPSDPAAHEAFMAFYKFIRDLLKSVSGDPGGGEAG